jgi:GAF domain-containing protein
MVGGGNTPDADEDRVQDSERAAIVRLAEIHTADQPLEATLTQVAELAATVVPHAQSAGLEVLSGKHPTIAASSGLAQAVDDVQFAVGEGPSITAVLEHRTVRSGSLGGEPTWPRFGPRVGRLGVQSALSVPLELADRVMGTVSLYARDKDAFDDDAVENGEQFARTAAIAVHNARVLEETRHLAAQLQAALDGRPAIDRAVGILMSRSGGTPEEAFERLRTLSQQAGRRIADLSAEITTDLTHRRRPPGRRRAD